MLVRLLIILALATGILESTALAKADMYVDDKLALRVTKEPGSTGSVATVRSGDKVEALETKNGYTKIITSKGSEGWVKSRYLVLEKPAIVRLKELADVENEKKALTNENDQLKTANKKLTTAAEINQQMVATLKKENATQKQLLEKVSSTPEADQNEDSLLKVLIKENETLKEKIFSIQQLLGRSDLVASQIAANGITTSAADSPAFEFRLPVTFGDWKSLFDESKDFVESINPVLLGLSFFGMLVSFFYGRFLLGQRIRRQYSGIKIW